MEALLSTGKTKAIGVSNYSKRYLEQLFSNATVIPAVNQIENHPALPQQEIVDLCKEKGIHIMAYSPLGSTGGPLFSAEPVVKIAEKHGVKPATVLLSYHSMFFIYHPSPLNKTESEIEKEKADSTSPSREHRTRQVCDTRAHRREQKAHRPRRRGHRAAQRLLGQADQGGQAAAVRVPTFWC